MTLLQCTDVRKLCSYLMVITGKGFGPNFWVNLGHPFEHGLIMSKGEPGTNAVFAPVPSRGTKCGRIGYLCTTTEPGIRWGASPISTRGG